MGEQNADYDYDEPTNGTHLSHFDNDDDDSEVDQGDSEVSEERFVLRFMFSFFVSFFLRLRCKVFGSLSNIPRLL